MNTDDDSLYDTEKLDWSTDQVSEDTVEQLADNVVEFPLSPKHLNYWLW